MAPERVFVKANEWTKRSRLTAAPVPLAGTARLFAKTNKKSKVCYMRPYEIPAPYNNKNHRLKLR